MSETFYAFGLKIPLYGLTIAVATTCLLLLASLFAEREKLKKGTVTLFATIAIPTSLLFARLLFVICNMDLYTKSYGNPWLALRFFDGGYAMTGVFVGVVLSACITAKIVKVNMAMLMDLLVIPLSIWLAIVRFAERFTALGVGKVVNEGFMTQYFPWLFKVEQMGISTEYRLLVYGYEATIALLLAIGLYIGYRAVKNKKERLNGQLFMQFFVWYGSSQVLMESMRDDGHMLLIFLRVGQLCAMLMPMIMLIKCLKYGTVWQRITSIVLFSLALIMVVVLEFSLDGRLSFGHPTLLRDYSLMTVCCIVFALVPSWMQRQKKSICDNSRVI